MSPSGDQSYKLAYYPVSGTRILNMDLELIGKTALVTGSNRGTGFIIASQLLNEGANVILHSIDSGLAAEAAKTLPGALAVDGDISSDAGAEQVKEQLLSLEVSPDILVNNYGTALPGSWSSLSTEDWLDAYQKNTLSAVRMANLLTPYMRQQGFGRVVNLGTIGSTRPNSRMPHYYASKGAMANMTVSLAKELSGTGITVNLVSPGLIRTPEVESHYLARAKEAGWGDTWDAAEAKITEHYNPNLIGRMATREEVAQIVIFLCGSVASFVTAQNLRVDGGAVDIV